MTIFARRREGYYLPTNRASKRDVEDAVPYKERLAQLVTSFKPTAPTGRRSACRRIVARDALRATRPVLLALGKTASRKTVHRTVISLANPSRKELEVYNRNLPAPPHLSLRDIFPSRGRLRTRWRGRFLFSNCAGKCCQARAREPPNRTPSLTTGGGTSRTPSPTKNGWLSWLHLSNQLRQQMLSGARRYDWLLLSN